jgi:cyanophycinase
MRKIPYAVIAFSVAACAGFSGSSSTANAPATRGHLLIAGGGPIPESVTRRFVELAGGAGRARIAVFPTASALTSTGPDKVAQLESLGARSFVVNVSRANADADSVVRMLDSATGVWLAGGDQNRITTAIRGTRMEEKIRERYLAGAVIGGTSAGAAAMTGIMITGEEKRPGGARPLTDSSQAWVTIDRDNVATTAGLGLMTGAIVDQHFVRRRRNNRLLSLVLEHPDKLGAGIDESTALDVRPDGSWEVLGSSVVVVFDARRSRSAGKDSPLGAADVRMHVLPAGSTVSPSGLVSLPGKRAN